MTVTNFEFQVLDPRPPCKNRSRLSTTVLDIKKIKTDSRIKTDLKVLFQYSENVGFCKPPKKPCNKKASEKCKSVESDLLKYTGEAERG